MQREVDINGDRCSFDEDEYPINKSNGMQQAIEEAKKMRDELINDREVQLLNMVIERLEKLPQDNGWISVEDRLPEKEGEYNAVQFGSTVNIDWKNGQWEWGTNDGTKPGKTITHWQPLLLPPK